jgi:uncharacterized protein (DUF1800 family)
MSAVARLLFVCTLLFATGGLAAPMGADEARHLLVRTGFGATPAEIADFARLSREQAVERLLNGAATQTRTPPPASVNEYTPPRQIRQLSDEERKAFQRRQFQNALELRSWWLTEMLTTPSPLTERMTLFWHNHFVTSQQKVKSTKLMYQQNVLLRRHALGNFATALHEVSKDPAMIVYLDSATNRKGQPNENFAREVMELFTLGEGRYGEQDIKEAARAFTGWSIEPDSGEFRWRPFAHDGGVKTVLGRSGNFDGDAVLDILLARPETAETIVAKLWREFVSPQPDPREVQRLARRFKDGGYEIKPLLRELLLSPAFHARENRGSLIKSPADLVVGTLHQFEVSVPDALPFVFLMNQLGQNLFSPPNVKGWPGGESWINSTTLLARKQFVERLFRGEEGSRSYPVRVAMSGDATAGEGDVRPRVLRKQELGKGVGRMGDEGRQRLMRAMLNVHFDSRAWLQQVEAGRAGVAAVVLATDPVSPVAAQLQGIELIRSLALDPAYQLR